MRTWKKPIKLDQYRKEGRYVPIRESAQFILSQKTIITDRFGNSYEYNGRFWEPLPLQRLENYAYHLDPDQNWSSPKKPNSLAYHIQQMTIALEEIPWSNLKATEVPFWNGVYDVTRDQLRPHQPEDYLETVLPIPYNPKAQAPTWDAYLQHCFGNLPDNEDRVSVIEEFFGYILIQKAPYKKALLCFGESNTGKTVLESVMETLVGKHNVCHIPIDKMDKPREAAPIKGKALNIMSELKFGTILSDSGFKRMVSIGESIQIDPKWQQPSSYTPFCKHVVFTNEKPTIHDHYDAVYNRLILLEFPNVIPKEQQDPELPQKLQGEIEGIALKALEGLKRLTANKGQFTVSPSVEEALAEYQKDNNPMHAFLTECCVSYKKGYVFMDDVRRAFREYQPRHDNWSNTRITQTLKKLGCDIRETSRQGQKGSFLFGYYLTPRYCRPDTLQQDRESKGTNEDF